MILFLQKGRRGFQGVIRNAAGGILPTVGRLIEDSDPVLESNLSQEVQ